MNCTLTYKRGLKDGLPIGVAYLAVSFTFGMLAVRGGIPVWLTTMISATNLTSAGQFAGVNLISMAAGYFEIALAVFVINSRYMLMSLSLSQQLSRDTGTGKRLLMSCFVTDEIFAIASTRGNALNFKYFLGLATAPYIGWTIGTLMGASINSVLPASLQNAMGIALYCMFIAIIIPPATKSKAIVLTIALSVALSCLMEFVPGLNKISFGFRVIIASVISAGVTALVAPIKGEDDGDKEGGDEEFDSAEDLSPCVDEGVEEDK